MKDSRDNNSKASHEWPKETDVTSTIAQRQDEKRKQQVKALPNDANGDLFHERTDGFQVMPCPKFATVVVGVLGQEGLVEPSRHRHQLLPLPD